MRTILLLIFIQYIIPLQIYAQSNPRANCYASLKDNQLSIKLIMTNETKSDYAEMQFDEFFSSSVFVPISEWLVRFNNQNNVIIGPWREIENLLISGVLIIPDSYEEFINPKNLLDAGGYPRIEYLPKFIHIKSNDATFLMLKYDIPTDSLFHNNYNIFIRLPFINFYHISIIDEFYKVIPNIIENDLNSPLNLNKHLLIDFSKRNYSLYSSLNLDELLYAFFKISMDSNFIDCNCSAKPSD